MLQMFKYDAKVYLTLSRREYVLLRECLLRWRNKLLAQGRCASPVDELLENLLAH